MTYGKVLVIQFHITIIKICLETIIFVLLSNEKNVEFALRFFFFQAFVALYMLNFWTKVLNCFPIAALHCCPIAAIDNVYSDNGITLTQMKNF